MAGFWAGAHGAAIAAAVVLYSSWPGGQQPVARRAEEGSSSVLQVAARSEEAGEEDGFSALQVSPGGRQPCAERPGRSEARTFISNVAGAGKAATGVDTTGKDAHLCGDRHVLSSGMDLDLVSGLCNRRNRPMLDSDPLRGHGSAACRYEPSREDLARQKANPIDLAIVVPHSEISSVPTSPEQLQYTAEYSMYSWKAYADFHNYSFYAGAIRGPDPECLAELEGPQPGRSKAWWKPCVALQLIDRHDYLLVVDADTFVNKPLLRMEQLFEMTGLLKEGSGAAVAVAEEWGSCDEARGGIVETAGRVNTGVVLLKRTAKDMLRHWVHNPPCQKHTGPDCRVYHYSLKNWAFDQLGFDRAVLRRFPANVTVLPAGCPVNSPWGDFVSHLVSGSFNRSFYDQRNQKALIRAAQGCVAHALKQADPYWRCSLCDLLPRSHSGFDVSCPRGSW